MRKFFEVLLLFLVLGLTRPNNPPEYGIVEDFVDIEPENYRQTHLFEDFNYEVYNREIFLRQITTEFRNLIAFYQNGLKKILSDKKLKDKTSGPLLTKLLGEDFSQFSGDIKDLEIKLKAYVEKEINMFFLYKCHNRFFSEREKLSKCDQLKLEVRNFLMFKNFFGFGYLNELHSLLYEKEFGSAFEEAFLIKIEDLSINFKLPMTLIWFTRDQMKATMLRKIKQRFGQGIKIQFILKKPENPEGGSGEEVESNQGLQEESQAARDALAEMVNSASSQVDSLSSISENSHEQGQERGEEDQDQVTKKTV